MGSFRCINNIGQSHFWWHGQTITNISRAITKRRDIKQLKLEAIKFLAKKYNIEVEETQESSKSSWIQSWVLQDGLHLNEQAINLSIKEIAVKRMTYGLHDIQITEKWYAYWLANDYFHSKPRTQLECCAIKDKRGILSCLCCCCS